MKPRRVLRYSLRTMLIVVLVLSVWLAYHANRAARQRRAVASVKGLGGHVLYDFQYAFWRENRPNRLILSELPQQPKGLLSDVLGHEWYCDVLWVHLESGVNDAQFGEILNGLPEVVSLKLVDCDITDASVANIARLAKLKLVSISGTDMTTEGIRKLRQARPDLNVNHRSAPVESQPRTSLSLRSSVRQTS